MTGGLATLPVLWYGTVYVAKTLYGTGQGFRFGYFIFKKYIFSLIIYIS